MASITSSGIGSGLDVASLVQQLVAAEGQPTENRIARQEAQVQGKLSAYGSLKSALSEFRDQLDKMQDMNTLLTRKGLSGNDELFKVTASNSASPASYAVEVVALATAQKLTSGAFDDADAAVGTGTLHIDVGGAGFDLEITEENNTLAGIRDAINGAAANTGVAATIVNAESGSYLILTGEATGSAATVTITQSDGDGGLAALEYDPGNGLTALTEASAAADALLRIDGFDVVSSSNTVTSAIEGVTINLVDAGDSATLTVANDAAAVRKSLTAFADSYNALVDTLKELTAYNADTEIAGPLLGDSGLRNIRDQLRRELSTNVNDAASQFKSLSEIGLSMDLSGKMEIDDGKLDTALGTDFAQVGQLFAGNEGFAVRLFDRVDGFLSSSGVIESRTDGLSKTIDLFTEQRERLAQRLTALETRLTRQFSALDALIGQLSSTSNFLAQQLENLPGISRPNSK